MERVRNWLNKGTLQRVPLILPLVLLFLSPSLSRAQKDTASGSSGGGSSLNGEKIFKANCASCHSPGDDVVVGPGLKGINDRWDGKKDLLYKWIQNPNEAAQSGDSYIEDLVAEWKPKAGMMTPQAVSKKEIDAILDYVKNYKPEEPKGGKAVADAEGAAKKKEGDLWFWLIVLGILFLIIVFSLNGVRRSLLNAVREKEGKSPVGDVPVRTRVYEWMVKHKALTSIIIIFLVLGGLKDGWDWLMDVGVYKGYQPEQPIKFSHELHAGQNDISCVYCHSSVKEGKNPTIPSANVCMNCHRYIKEGPKHGKKEIAKIYDAIGWDPETQTYSGEKKPIRWVKVHELPDLAYFNHAQHTNVAELDCEECHGKVEEMEVVKQNAELTMGWCINCHNKTEVKMEGNGYYKEIMKRMPDSLHKKYLYDEKITARELGGWECAKCHY